MSTKLKARDQRYTAGQIDRWRAKLAVGDAITSLNECAQGKIEASTARIKSCEIILRKCLPDLATIELQSGGEGITFTWSKAEPKDISPGEVIDGTASTVEASKGTEPDTSQDTAGHSTQDTSTELTDKPESL